LKTEGKQLKIEGFKFYKEIQLKKQKKINYQKQ
jgi:hypothetical protein